MAKDVDIDYAYVKEQANKCQSTCVAKIKKYNAELDQLVMNELMPVWKSVKANKLYKKYKGHINNNYKWNEKIDNLCSELIRTSKAVIDNS